MKNLILYKFICLLIFAASCALFTGCEIDINNYEKETASEASNKVFVSEKYATLPFKAYRTAEGIVPDTLITKMVVNCTSPALSRVSVRVTIDTLLIDVYNAKNDKVRQKIQGNWIRLNKSALTIREGATESDTLTISLARSLSKFSPSYGYIMPIRITSASGYDAQVDYSKRVSYLTLDIIQETNTYTQ